MHLCECAVGAVCVRDVRLVFWEADLSYQLSKIASPQLSNTALGTVRSSQNVLSSCEEKPANCDLSPPLCQAPLVCKPTWRLYDCVYAEKCCKEALIPKSNAVEPPE